MSPSSTWVHNGAVLAQVAGDRTGAVEYRVGSRRSFRTVVSVAIVAGIARA